MPRNLTRLFVVLALPALGWSPASGAETPETATDGGAPDRATLALEAVGEGALALRKGDLAEACRSFGEAVSLTPTWAMARFELGRCLRLAGDPTGEAEAHLREAMAGLPDRGVVRLELGRLLEDQGRRKEARTFYREALKLIPADVRADSGSARLHGNPAEAVQALRRVLRRVPAELALWSRLAEAAEAAGLLDEAEEALRHVLDHGADRPRAAAALARFGERTGRSAAVEAARKVRPER